MAWSSVLSGISQSPPSILPQYLNYIYNNNRNRNNLLIVFGNVFFLLPC